MNAGERRSAFICVHPRLKYRLADAVGAAFPDDDDLAVEFVSDGLDRRLIGHECPILFGAARECHAVFRRIVSGVDPDAAFFLKTTSSDRSRIRTHSITVDRSN